MKKLCAIVPRDEADELTKRLLWLENVEITNTDEGHIERFDIEAQETAIMVRKLAAAVKSLTPYSTAKTGLFSHRPTVGREEFDASSQLYSDCYADAERVEEISYRQAELAGERVNDTAAFASLLPWENAHIPLDVIRTKETRVLFGTLPPQTDVQTSEAGFDEDESVSLVEISRDISAVYIVAFVAIDGENKSMSALSSAGFVRFDTHELAGTAADNIKRLRGLIAALDEENSVLEEEKRKLAARLPAIKLCLDFTSTRLARTEAKRKLTETEATVILTGWTPAKAEAEITAELERMTCCYGFTEPREGDEVPVLLKNPEPFCSFESVVSLYSMPKYATFDPTLIMSFFYFVIFGFMLADVVYGALLAVGGLLAIKLLDLKGGVRNLVKMFAVCGVACIIAGLLFGSWFGDFPIVFAKNMLGIDLGAIALWFDPISNPIMFLVLSIVIGAVHLLTGMGIKFYILWSRKKYYDAIFDIGSWFILFAGIGLFVLIGTVGAVVAGIGVLMLIYSQGREAKNPFIRLFKGVGSLYSIMNYISDLLSYSRIMALGLSSAVVASVINILATLIGPSIPGYIAMLVILVFGHSLNLAINLLGSFVHASRLQYIEFFGKFFEDGGKPFKPLTADTKYTNISR